MLAAVCHCHTRRWKVDTACWRHCTGWCSGSEVWWPYPSRYPNNWVTGLQGGQFITDWWIWTTESRPWFYPWESTWNEEPGFLLYQRSGRFVCCLTCVCYRYSLSSNKKEKRNVGNVEIKRKFSQYTRSVTCR